MSPADDLFQIPDIKEPETLVQHYRALELEHRYHLTVIKDLRYHITALKRETIG
ncbi:hypothetical protein ACFQDN_19630 [Pseudomonas asuensis]